MKKVLLLIISLLFIPAVFAYETVLVDLPESEGWHAVYYTTTGSESILQYVPANQTDSKWTKTLVFHSYKNIDWTDSAAGFMDRTTAQMEARNSSHQYRYTKYTDMDSMATRCVQGNKLIPTQCEIYRVSKSFEGLISMHYINKNVQDYKSNYSFWYNLVQNIAIYRSYYREDRIMDKATSFEL